MRNRSSAAWLVAALMVTAMGAWAAEPKQATTVEDAYPGLATGILAYATLGSPPPGVLVQAGAIQVTDNEVNNLQAKAHEPTRTQIRNNAFYLVEQMVTQRILLPIARQAAAQAGKNLAGKQDHEVIEEYLKSVGSQAVVTDAEIADYYNQNKAVFGNAALPQVNAEIKQMLIEDKQGDAIAAHIQNLGKAMVMVVSAPWAAEQSQLLTATPLEQARASGRPTLASFSAPGGNPPADPTAPIVQAVLAKYAGKLNVVPVNVAQERIFAARYGVVAVPAQIFFDKDGKEESRHTGPLSQGDIEKTLKELGVQ